MPEIVDVRCPYCGEPMQMQVDARDGADQNFVSDCEVCCRPIRFHVRIEEDGDAVVSAQAESE
jgi:hypothetical protein